MVEMSSGSRSPDHGPADAGAGSGAEDGRGVGCASRTAQRHSPQRPFRREQGMNNGPDRHHGEAWLILALLVVETGQRLGAGPSGRLVQGASSQQVRRVANA